MEQSKLFKINFGFNRPLTLLSLLPAPCVPTDVQNALDCLSGVLTITWQQSGYTPNHYHAELTSSEGLLTVCDTNVTTCVVSRMQCGLTYSVVVVAHDDVCNSTYSPAQQVTAGRIHLY